MAKHKKVKSVVMPMMSPSQMKKHMGGPVNPPESPKFGKGSKGKHLNMEGPDLSGGGWVKKGG